MSRLMKKTVSFLVVIAVMVTCCINIAAVSTDEELVGLAYDEIRVNTDEIRILFAENLKNSKVSDTVIVNTETG